MACVAGRAATRYELGSPEKLWQHSNATGRNCALLRLLPREGMHDVLAYTRRSHGYDVAPPTAEQRAGLSKIHFGDCVELIEPLHGGFRHP